MPYSFADSETLEAEREGRVKRVRLALGVTAFGINELHLGPNATGSEHDESATGQEELYFVLAGSGTMLVEGDVLDLRPGRYVCVPPGTMRQIRAGDGGLTSICVGCQPGCYRPRS